jgi:hypothetical protein
MYARDALFQCLSRLFLDPSGRQIGPVPLGKENGAICMIVAGIFFDGTPLPMIAGIAICAVITFVIAQVTVSRNRVWVSGTAGHVGIESIVVNDNICQIWDNVVSSSA